MHRKLLIATLTLLIAAGAAWAGDHEKDPHAGCSHAQKAEHHAADAEAMMAEWMNCSICKNLVPHMADLGPAMKHDMIRTEDGVVLIHSVTDESKRELFHTMSAKMEEAGDASNAYTAEEAKEHLCEYCQEMYGVMAAGAKMSRGKNDDSYLMVLSSDDPEVQAKIAAFYERALAMMGG